MKKCKSYSIPNFNFLILFLIAFLPVMSQAQSSGYNREQAFCHSDELLQQSLKDNPGLIERINEMDESIRRIKEQFQYGAAGFGGGGSGSGTNLIIPVVVYVVHENGPENISTTQIQSQIDRMNTEFASHGIQFCLATMEGNDTLPGDSANPGIIRINNSLSDHLTSDEASLKALSNLSSSRYLKIWVVKDINNNSGIAGYARFPGTVSPSLDGIVVRYDVFGDVATCSCSTLLPGYDQGKVMVHEVGHYLDLYHTFQGGCAGMSSGTCDTQGDKVCDTPPVATSNSGCPTLGSVNSCFETPDNPDLTDNHMDYTNDNCRDNFTNGQETRMVSAISLYRATLVSSANLTYTGIQCNNGLLATISADDYNPCVNDSVTFTANTISGATYTWTFGDGNSATGNPVKHAYSTANVPYTVILTVYNATDTVSTTAQIYVSPCGTLDSAEANWFYGTYCAVDFSSGAPVPTNAASSPQTISSYEASVSVSDNSGNLLFYSNAEDVWDNTHTVINSSSLNGNSSASQMAYCPNPADPDQYYLFITPSKEQHGSANDYFKYAIVDVSAGTVTTVDSVPDQPTDQISESITVVPHCNGTDYWVIIHSYGSTVKKFYVYRVTASGITNASGSGSIPDAYPSSGNFTLYTGAYYAGAQLKASPDGSKLALGGNGVATYDFDRSTGEITNELILDNSYIYYGVSFSPSGQKVYGTAPNDSRIQAFDLSGNLLHSFSQYNHQIAIGPDDKLYFAKWFSDYTSCIPNPDAASPTYIGVAIDFSTVSSSIQTKWGLPDMIDAKTVAELTLDFTYTTNSCETVDFDATPCFYPYSWNFGDTLSGTGDTSSLEDPTHIFSGPGTYTVTLIGDGDTVIKVITIDSVNTSFAGPPLVCLDDSVIANYSTAGGSSYTYSWSVSGGTIAGLNGLDNIDVSWSTLPGTVKLVVTDTVTGCTDSSTLTVTEFCNIPDQGNWYFGRYCVINFASGFPVPDNSAYVNSTLISGQTSVSVSDNSGNLQFYSNGEDIWDESHTLMNSGPLGGHQSAAQMAYCPDPANTNLMYVFMPPASEQIGGADNYFKYFMVDTIVDTISATFSVPGTPGSQLGESITVVPNCDGTVYWVIVHSKGNTTNKFYVYKVSSAGITNAAGTGNGPDTYPAVGNFTLGTSYTTYIGNELKASRQGDKLVLAGNGLAVYDFDVITGEVSNENVLDQTYSYYGSSFSPSGNVVYGTAPNQTLVRSFDLSGTLQNSWSKPIYGIQLGPDNKLYLSRHFQSYISCIPDPDAASPGFVDVAVDFSGIAFGVTDRLSLPNMIDAQPDYYGPNSASFTYSQNCLDVSFDGAPCLNNYSWNFGDPGSGGANTSSLEDPSHVFSGVGSYVVTLIAGGDTITDTIAINALSVSITGEDTICDPVGGFWYTSSGSGIQSYQWYASGGTINGSSTASKVNVSWGSGGGTITLVVTGTTPGCQDSVTITVIEDCCELEANFSWDQSGCWAQFFAETIIGENCEVIGYVWDFDDPSSGAANNSNQAEPIHIFTANGTYNVCLTVTAICGSDTCTDTICQEIEISDCKEECSCGQINMDFSWVEEGCEIFFTDKTFIEGDCEIVNWSWNFGDPTTGFNNYSNDPNPSHVFSSSGSYTVCLTVNYWDGNFYCTETFCQEVDVSCKKSAFSESINYSLNVYPNPFSRSLFIEIDLPVAQDLAIYVLDASGKRIALLNDQFKEEGKYTFTWNVDGSTIAKGLYLIQVRTNKGYQYQKVILE